MNRRNKTLIGILVVTLVILWISITSQPATNTPLLKSNSSYGYSTGPGTGVIINPLGGSYSVKVPAGSNK